MTSPRKSKEAQAAQDALLAAFLRLYLRLERCKAGVAKKAAAALAAIPDSIAADLRRAQAFQAARPETRLARLKSFSRDAAVTVQDAYKGVCKNLRPDLATVAKRVGVATSDAMNQAAGFNLAEYAPDGDVLRGAPYGADILGPTVSVWLGRQAVQLGQRIADIARAGVLGGDPAALVKAVVDRAAAYTETKRNYEDACAPVRKHHHKLETLREAAYAVLEEEGLPVLREPGRQGGPGHRRQGRGGEAGDAGAGGGPVPGLRRLPLRGGPRGGPLRRHRPLDARHRRPVGLPAQADNDGRGLIL
jgi:hypothetical protein